MLSFVFWLFLFHCIRAHFFPVLVGFCLVSVWLLIGFCLVPPDGCFYRHLFGLALKIGHVGPTTSCDGNIIPIIADGPC